MPAHFYISPQHFQAAQEADATHPLSAGDQHGMQNTSLVTGLNFTLNSQLTRHIATVMRARPGQQLDCFDGQGQRFTVTIVALTRRQVEVEVAEVFTPIPRAVPGTHLLLSVLKGQAMDRALQLATEVGADQITLLNAGRSNTKLPLTTDEKKFNHWQRIIITACEQSGRLHLPVLSLGQSWQAALDATPDNRMLVLDMAGRRMREADVDAPLTLLIGPEGGWAEAEIELFNRYQIERINIAETTLRAETAPGIALALVSHLRAG